MNGWARRRTHREAEASTMHFYRAIAQSLAGRDALTREAGFDARDARAARLGRLDYGDVLREQAVYDTAEEVAERLLELREALGFTSLSAWMNVGGQIPHEGVMTSMRLFCERVAPRLR